MKTSEKGLAIIKKYEGLYLEAYKCPAGVPTIGYGHTAGVKMGQKITKSQAETFLKQDVAGAEKAVSAIGKNFNQNQFDALVSFTFNLGAGNLKTLCKNRTISQIGEKIILYDKANGEQLAGLVRRRKEEQALYKTSCAGKTMPSAQPANAKQSMPMIRKGAKGDAVRKLQQALLKQHFKTCIIRGKEKLLTIDGDWGEITDSIFRRWQGYVGLAVDGICGPKSWAKLGY